MEGAMEGVTDRLRGAEMGGRMAGVGVEEKVGNVSRAVVPGNTPKPAGKCTVD